ncbi:MAG: P-loop NTPase [Planctomycetota bacterium]
MTERLHGVHLPCPFLLVTGGKGGVGKSTVAANLGVELARRGVDTLLVDLDLGLANLDVLLKLERVGDVEDLLTGRREIEDCVVRGPAGVHVLAASAGAAELARPDAERRRALLDEVARLASAYQVVIGDSAAGIGEDVLAFAAAASRVLVVTSPEPAAVTDAYGVIKALDGWAAEAGVEVPTPDLFVNFASGHEEARRVAKNLRDVAARFLARSPRFLGWMPRSRSVLTAGLGQQSFVLTEPDSPASRCLHRLAEQVGGRAAAVSALKALDCHVR